METIFVIAALVAMGIMYCMDSKNRENELEISELKGRIKYLESRESSLKESKEYYMERAEKYETLYCELCEKYDALEEKLDGITKADTNSTIH